MRCNVCDLAGLTKFELGDQGLLLDWLLIFQMRMSFVENKFGIYKSKYFFLYVENIKIFQVKKSKVSHLTSKDKICSLLFGVRLE